MTATKEKSEERIPDDLAPLGDSLSPDSGPSVLLAGAIQRVGVPNDAYSAGKPPNDYEYFTWNAKDGRWGSVGWTGILFERRVSPGNGFPMKTQTVEPDDLDTAIIELLQELRRGPMPTGGNLSMGNPSLETPEADPQGIAPGVPSPDPGVSPSPAAPEEPVPYSNPDPLVTDVAGFVRIKFQKGHVKEVGTNGTTTDVVIQLLIDHLKAFQEGPLSCRETAMVITKLEEARMWVDERQRNRAKEGVLYTEKPHGRPTNGRSPRR